ncbi:MAPK kinase substrate protein At1g80180-like [Primulina eburnea]|uniref:MAPK kinase substrate protein At1g80180-like n=1 Tax=Primulina eburnea TaxID=1245227 RepID=UPI003C6C6E60
MAGLQRSGTSFRRHGSSGLVWDDQKYFSVELRGKAKFEELSQHDQVCTITRNTYCETNTLKEVSALSDPPSPRLSGCGMCPIFGRAESHSKKQREGNKLNF